MAHHGLSLRRWSRANWSPATLEAESLHLCARAGDPYVQTIGSGDWIATIARLTGTHTGSLPAYLASASLPATGKGFFDALYSTIARWQDEKWTTAEHIWPGHETVGQKPPSTCSFEAPGGTRTRTLRINSPFAGIPDLQ
jgi:hypothetical protein